MSSFIGRLWVFYELCQFLKKSFLVEFESVQNSFLFFVIQPEHLLVSNGWIMLTGFAIKIKAHQSLGQLSLAFLLRHGRTVRCHLQ